MNLNLSTLGLSGNLFAILVTCLWRYDLHAVELQLQESLQSDAALFGLRISQEFKHRRLEGIRGLRQKLGRRFVSRMSTYNSYKDDKLLLLLDELLGLFLDNDLIRPAILHLIGDHLCLGELVPLEIEPPDVSERLRSK